MKKRIISAVIALIIIIPIIIIGGNPYKIAVIALATLALLELIKIKKVPLLVKIITVFNFLVLMFCNINTNTLSFNIPLSYLIMNALSLLLPIIFYHDKKEYSIEDAAFMIFSNIFLAIAFSILMIIRDENVKYLIFILLITFTTDIFAYAVGMLIGRHKFSLTISPNKSVEGFIGGLVFSVFITTALYITVFDFTGNIFILVSIMMLLSVLSTLGDLAFSAIKRHYNIKDFGKIMPGHGGVLDRLDSLIFVLLTFYLIINLI